MRKPRAGWDYFHGLRKGIGTLRKKRLQTGLRHLVITGMTVNGRHISEIAAVRPVVILFL